MMPESSAQPEGTTPTGRCMACGGVAAGRYVRLRRTGTNLIQAGTDPVADASPVMILMPTPAKLLGAGRARVLGGRDECRRKPSLMA